MYFNILFHVYPNLANVFRITYNTFKIINTILFWILDHLKWA